MNPLKTAGYIYCIYNESFKSYGENTFKLGRTGNLNNRLNNYTTYYISPCKFLFTSLDCERKFKDCIKAERILFYILRKYRVSNKREFFSCDIQIIKDTITRISSFTNEMIDAMYKALMNKIVPNDVIERISSCERDNEKITDKDWFKYEKGNLDSIYTYLEQFRFRPKKGNIYNDYTSPEDTELLGLIAKTEPTIKMYRNKECINKAKITFID